jgi:hypothetical protein
LAHFLARRMNYCPFMGKCRTNLSEYQWAKRTFPSETAAQNERLYLPDDRRIWPHPAFLAHHRELYVGKAH